jgi:general secretion pathway protein H
VIRRGVTLIETLVVLALIALLASVAVLNAPALRSNAREEAERFAVKASAAQTLALISGAPVRVDFSPTGYGFRTFRDDAWAEIVDPRSLRRRVFRGDVAVTLLSVEAALTEANDARRDGPKGEEHILIDPLGGGGKASAAFADPSGRWIVTLHGSDAPKVARDGG